MKQAAFEQLHGSTWQELERMVDALEKKTPLAAEDYRRFSSLFRKICHFHALAIERQYSSHLVDHLEDIVVRSQQQLYRRKSGGWSQFIRFVVAEFPQTVRREKIAVTLAGLLFVLPTFFLWVSTLAAPEMVYTVIDPPNVNRFESMYDPDNRVLGEARDSETNWYMFGYYIRNNIAVSFRTFASGLFLGIGSAFFLSYNGALFGALAGHVTNIGFHTPFFTFVIAHGSFELTAIVLAGAAGLKLGYAILAPGQRTRVESLREAAKVAIKLVYGVIVMLLIAAFIEAFWSSNNLFPAWLKYAVGAALWVLVLAYLCLSGRAGSTQR